MRGVALALAVGLVEGLVVGILAAGTAYAGPPGGPDADADGFPDVFDNCTAVANPAQTDADHNGCGDACTEPITCDFSGDTVVGAPDLLILGMTFGLACPPVPCCVGLVGVAAFLALGMEFGNQVGPSGIAAGMGGLAPAPLCNPASCICPP